MASTVHPCDSDHVRKLGRLVAAHEERISKVEEALTGIGEISETLVSIKRYVKTWGPVIATAAISSGIFSGRFGQFVAALLKGLGY